MICDYDQRHDLTLSWILSSDPSLPSKGIEDPGIQATHSRTPQMTDRPMFPFKEVSTSTGKKCSFQISSSSSSLSSLLWSEWTENITHESLRILIFTTNNELTDSWVKRRRPRPLRHKPRPTWLQTTPQRKTAAPQVALFLCVYRWCHYLFACLSVCLSFCIALSVWLCVSVSKSIFEPLTIDLWWLNRFPFVSQNINRIFIDHYHNRFVTRHLIAFLPVINCH